MFIGENAYYEQGLLFVVVEESFVFVVSFVKAFCFEYCFYSFVVCVLFLKKPLFKTKQNKTKQNKINRSEFWVSTRIKNKKRKRKRKMEKGGEIGKGVKERKEKVQS